MDASVALLRSNRSDKRFRVLNALLRLALVPLLCGQVAHAAVKTARKPVVNEYHGVKVTDDYQWLENAADPEVRRWSEAQNKQARAFLDKLPTRPWVEYRLGQLLNAPSTNYYSITIRRGRLFLLKFQPPAQQPVLITLSSVTNLASERVILDPNKLDPKDRKSVV